jgi:hypothetical protein
VNARRTALAAIITGLAVLVVAGAVIEPAGATPIKWLAVQLGVHQFGRLGTPDGLVARAGPKGVGFECGKPSACTSSKDGSPEGGCGCIDVLAQGPTSFDVARNGSVWLFDGVNHRLLVWQRGNLRPERSVRLPADVGTSDFALGADGTIYVFGNHVRGKPYLTMYALSATGRVRWNAPTTVGSQARLRVGSDGTVYAVGASERATWIPLTTPSGRPLSLVQQRRKSNVLQPLSAGLRLLVTQLSAHEIHFALVDQAHKVVRAWRVTSKTPVALASRELSPAVVGNDLVVAVDVSRQAKWEHEVLRLSASGVRQRIDLDAHAVWDPDGSTVATPLRIGPDGRLYQLRTNPKTGMSIARYSVG